MNTTITAQNLAYRLARSEVKREEQSGRSIRSGQHVGLICSMGEKEHGEGKCESKKRRSNQSSFHRLQVVKENDSTRKAGNGKNAFEYTGNQVEPPAINVWVFDFLALHFLVPILERDGYLEEALYAFSALFEGLSTGDNMSIETSLNPLHGPENRIDTYS